MEKEVGLGLEGSNNYDPAGATASASGIDVGGGWVLYIDANGQQYYWNEALQESRWALSLGVLRARRGEGGAAASGSSRVGLCNINSNMIVISIQ